jgi:hypothetical protein
MSRGTRILLKGSSANASKERKEAILHKIKALATPTLIQETWIRRAGLVGEITLCVGDGHANVSLNINEMTFLFISNIVDIKPKLQINTESTYDPEKFSSDSLF